MGQRLARAKAKIKLARLRFELPIDEDMPGRMADVLNGVLPTERAGTNLQRVGDR